MDIDDIIVLELGIIFLIGGDEQPLDIECSQFRFFCPVDLGLICVEGSCVIGWVQIRACARACAHVSGGEMRRKRGRGGWCRGLVGELVLQRFGSHLVLISMLRHT